MNGHFEWLRMPFGLKTAPVTFQRMIHTLLGDLKDRNVFAYLDDVIIALPDVDSHLASLETVLSRLQTAGLKVKLSKCEFLRNRIRFLGHEINENGIHTQADKIEAVSKFPVPKTADNVCSLLGLAGYYRPYVRHFSATASPLNQLLKKGVTFHWDAPQQKSFEDLKSALTSAPVLHFPDYAKPFTLYTDASQSGLGAALMQPDNCGKLGVIAFASRSLNRAESNYSVTHFEFLAIVWALKKFCDLVYGYPITMYTDHLPVTYLFKDKQLMDRLARWALTIQEYSPVIKYVPGRSNVVADALSRNVGAVTADPPPVENFSLLELRVAQREHDVWKAVIYALESGDETALPSLSLPFAQFFLSPDGVLTHFWPSERHAVEQYVIPETLVPTVLHLAHDAIEAGHLGRELTLSLLRTNYYWPTIKIDVERHVDRCVKCAQYKGVPSGPAPVLQYPPPSRPFDTVSIDVPQLPPSYQGSKFLLAMVDFFSRYVILAPLREKSARAVVHAIVTKLICEHSAPQVLLSDNGAEFRNKVLVEICRQFGIRQTFTVAYHPASNGLVERSNRKILEILRPIVAGHPRAWEDWIPQVAATINASVCDSTGQLPHYIVFGGPKHLPYDLLGSQQPPVYDPEDYAKIQLQNFSRIHHAVTEKLKSTSDFRTAKQHKGARPVSFSEGDAVMIATPDRQSKLSPKFSGTHLVTRVLGGINMLSWMRTRVLQRFITVTD